ncbi:unnamed protein product [Amoebophrya sp. A25]|nr:unnamed protein product [Amoebophrya sp. A25]|eukprot:GSA25T00019579001.1
MLPCIFEPATLAAVRVLEKAGSSTSSGRNSDVTADVEPSDETLTFVKVTRLIGYTSDNLREVGGHSVRLGLQPPLRRRVRPGIYLVSLEIGASALQEGGSEGSSYATTTSEPRRIVGLGAVPTVEQVGPNRIEVMLLRENENVRPGSESTVRYWREEEIREEIKVTSSPTTETNPNYAGGNHNIAAEHVEQRSSASPRPLREEITVRFLYRVADFSYIGVGPWLRDQILRHQDMVNQKLATSSRGVVPVVVDTNITPTNSCFEDDSAVTQYTTGAQLPGVAGGDRGQVESEAKEPDEKTMAQYWTKHGGI